MRKLLVYRDIGVYDARQNLAINEACLNSVEAGSPILRVYTFSSEGLILARHESIWDVRKPEIATRRNTAGSVIYCDPTTLGYSVFFRPEDLTDDVTKVFRLLTRPIAENLKPKLNGSEVSVGRVFSIRVEGKVLAGHAQYNTKKSVQYDGFVHVLKPDADKISGLIKLRELCGLDGNNVLCIDGEVFDMKGKFLGERERLDLKIIRKERDVIAGIPGLKGLGLTLEDYAVILKEGMESAFRCSSIESELPAELFRGSQEPLEKRYANKEWVKSGRKRHLGHCLVDFVEPEQGADPV